MGGNITPWGKRAKAILRNRQCYETIFEGAELAKPGKRDSTLFKHIGQVVSLLYPRSDRGIPETTPEHIYGLFLDPCLALEVNDNGLPWEDECWDMVLRLWAEEESKASEEIKLLQKKEASKLTIKDGLLKGLRLWCDAPEVLEDDTSALDWVEKHLIVSWNRHYFIMQPNGHYDIVPVSSTQLVARIRELGMTPIIPITTLKSNGQGYRDLRAQEIINRHATIVNEVEGVVNVSGGILEKAGTKDARLSIGLYGRREDIEPEWNEEVDTWIQQLCPDEETYTKLCTWIGHSLNFEGGPICALSLSGPPGCGKKMLVWGLAECISTQTVADSKELGRFASEILRTPFLTVNEGFHKLSGGLDPADAFRSFTGGDPIFVERKFEGAIRMQNPLRLIITSNNFAILKTLTSNRDLGPDDRDALAQRLFHVDVPPASSAWIRAKGGRQWTGAQGSRWIRGDDGARSDYVVAKHFLKLWEMRTEVPEENRFLVEGDRHAEIIRILATQSGFAPEIIEVILRMVEGEAPPDKGIVVQDRDIYVTAAGVIKYHRMHFTSAGTKLKTQSVLSVLRGLMAQGWNARVPTQLELEGGKQTFRACWVKLKADTLYREAMDCGYNCPRLENIVNPISSDEEKARLREAIDKGL